MVTYNHEKYIAKAIESVLMQNTTFPFELVIGEDCSSDRTKQIVQEYACNYPEIISAIFSEENVGMLKNSIRTLEACRGEYIAILEGDDYWTDRDKLQKQADFLEKNENYVMCAHDVKIDYEKDVTDKNQRRFTKPVISADFKNILDNHFIPTNSLFFRNLVGRYPAWMTNKKMLAGDVALELMLACHGKCYYMNETMAVKRINLGGVTADKTRSRNMSTYRLFLYYYINKYSKRKYGNLIFPRLFKSIIKNILVSISSFRIMDFLFSSKMLIFSSVDFLIFVMRGMFIQERSLSKLDVSEIEKANQFKIKEG